MQHEESSHEPLPLPSTDGSSRYPSRVLVVDDSATMRRTLARALREWGHEVIEAEGAHEAVAHLDPDLDLVLLDLALPRVHGLDVARTIRMRLRSEVPIILVTGHTGHTERLGAVEAGVNDFVPKPFQLAELRLRTEAQLRWRRLLERREHLALALLRRALVTAQVMSEERALRMERTAEGLARLLGLPGGRVTLLGRVAPLHDLGLLGSSDDMPSDDGEVAAAGLSLIGDAAWRPITLARALVQHRGEWWDGSGGPAGSAEDRIPLECRIVAVAAEWAAITEGRTDARTEAECLAHLQALAGSRLDPDLVERFLAARPDLRDAEG